MGMLLVCISHEETQRFGEYVAQRSHWENQVELLYNSMQRDQIPDLPSLSDQSDCRLNLISSSTVIGVMSLWLSMLINKWSKEALGGIYHTGVSPTSAISTLNEDGPCQMVILDMRCYDQMFSEGHPEIGHSVHSSFSVINNIHVIDLNYVALMMVFFPSNSPLLWIILQYHQI